MLFLEWKCVNFKQDFTEVSSHGSNQPYSSIGSDNGLAPVRRQAIVWINDGLVSLVTHMCVTRPQCVRGISLKGNIWIGIFIFNICVVVWYTRSHKEYHILHHLPLCFDLLTHWGGHEMPNISQTTFSNAFSRIKMFQFWRQCGWSLFLMVQLAIIQLCFR